MDNKWLETRNQCLKKEGFRTPEKIDDYVNEIYNLMKDKNFSIIEAEKIIEYLKNRIDIDKKLILRESLHSTEKYKTEGC